MSKDAADPKVPPATRRLRALAFGGGAFDTIMQLGVVHALLVSRGKAPDHVVGISAGAVNAAALAEILQAGETLPDTARMAMQVRRLRSFLDAYLDFLPALADSVLPDTFEVNAKQPLKPVELPIHFERERQSRADATRSKAGLIQLFNDLLAVRMPVSAVTRMVRRLLAFKQAPELRRPIAPCDTILSNAIWLWLTLGRYMIVVAGIFFGLVYAAIVGGNRTVRRWLGSPLIRFATQSHRHWLQRLAATIFGEENATAGMVIQRSGVLRVFGSALRGSLAVIAFTLIWLMPFRLVSPPQTVVTKLHAAFPVEEAPDGSWTTLGDRLGPLVEAIVDVPSPSAELLVGNAVEVAKTTYPVLDTGGRILWNFLVQNRAIVGVPLLVLAGAIALEMVVGVEVAAGIAFLAVVAMNWPARHWYDRSLPFMVLLVICVLIPLLPSMRRRIFQYYEIGDGLLSSDALRAYLVRCFDPEYYGEPKIDAIVSAALERKNQVDAGAGATPVCLSRYSDPQRMSPIHIGVVAADVASGDLNLIEESKPVVDALLAATAAVPLFQAQDLDKGGRWLIDGINVSNEPIQPLLDDLRSRHNKNPAAYADVKTVDVYPVSDLPVDHSALPSSADYTTLVEVGLRALELKQFRDATMERRLTRLYTKALPSNRAFHPTKTGGEERTFIHAGVFPIELAKPARINRRLARGSSPEEFKKMLRESVADGCRAALEAMLPRAIAARFAPGSVTEWVKKLESDGILSTSDAKSIFDHPEFPQNVIAAEANARQLTARTVTLEIAGSSSKVTLDLQMDHAERLREIVAPRCLDVVRGRVGVDAALPGSDARTGPGLAEICRHCSLCRPEPARDAKSEVEPVSRNRYDSAGLQRLRVTPGRSTWPQWPAEKDGPDPIVAAEPPPIRHAYAEYEWPATPWPPDAKRPVVSFLFGGGVFRGVFHMGVANALNEAGVEPHLVAGSSVGAIIAAMIAAVFKDTGAARQRRILDLTATFLAIDRLVLTDRLADFVRRFTLRAAEAEFSLHDLDRVLRQFDRDEATTFNRRLRRVAAGLERLFYFSPFELYRVVEALRMRQPSIVINELCDDVQELLERGGLAQEILGAEPLSLLIRHHVIEKIPAVALSDEPLFENFLQAPNRIFFLATTTNLSAGSLEILGAPWNERTHVSLEYGLLASSAFPAVFRPRQSWEIFRDNDRDEKYIDGGTIDNLPLDAVARFLDEAEKHGKIERRPAAPHLLFTASLDVDREVLRDDRAVVERAAKDCVKLMSRAGTFKDNRKIDTYANVQRRLRNIHSVFGGQVRWHPLDMHVIAVKPNWLCKTFGFHPMLGFRRKKQAESIAHGCASTLATLYLSSLRNPEWLTSWGASKLDIDPKAVVESGTRKPAFEPQKRRGGFCWFRADRKCPYSRQALQCLNGAANAGTALTPTQMDELDAVYRACGRKATHERRG